MAVVLTPLIYLFEKGIESYFGKEITMQMKHAAMGKVNE
jgi:hypothetical protein